MQRNGTNHRKVQSCNALSHRMSILLIIHRLLHRFCVEWRPEFPVQLQLPVSLAILPSELPKATLQAILDLSVADDETALLVPRYECELLLHSCV